MDRKHQSGINGTATADRVNAPAATNHSAPVPDETYFPLGAGSQGVGSGHHGDSTMTPTMTPPDIGTAFNPPVVYGTPVAASPVHQAQPTPPVKSQDVFKQLAKQMQADLKSLHDQRASLDQSTEERIAAIKAEQKAKQEALQGEQDQIVQGVQSFKVMLEGISGVTPRPVAPQAVTPRPVAPQAVTPRPVAPQAVAPKVGRPRGRPPGRPAAQQVVNPTTRPDGAPRRGRPKGSKNKPKAADQPTTTAANTGRDGPSTSQQILLFCRDNSPGAVTFSQIQEYLKTTGKKGTNAAIECKRLVDRGMIRQHKSGAAKTFAYLSRK